MPLHVHMVDVLLECKRNDEHRLSEARQRLKDGDGRPVEHFESLADFLLPPQKELNAFLSKVMLVLLLVVLLLVVLLVLTLSLLQRLVRSSRSNWELTSKKDEQRP